MTLRRRGRSLLSRFALAITFSAGLFAADFEWNLPKRPTLPAIPSGNPMSAAKIELGRYLFYDKRNVGERESFVWELPPVRSWHSRTAGHMRKTRRDRLIPAAARVW